MTLEDDLAAWIAERHDWQKDVVARFCRNETLADEDVEKIALRFDDATGGFWFSHHAERFPLAPSTYAQVLTAVPALRTICAPRPGCSSMAWICVPTGMLRSFMALPILISAASAAMIS